MKSDNIKRDCFGFKRGECTVLTELVCKKGECTFYKTRKQFRDDADEAKKKVERKKKDAQQD